MVEVRVPEPEEYDSFLKAMGVTFSFEPSEFSRELLEDLIGPDRLLAAFDGPEPVATYGSFPFVMQVPGGSIPTSAVTIIAVSPTHRRQGILSSFMAADLVAAKERGEPVASLWASETGIYGRFGFGVANTESTWELAKSSAHLKSPIDIRGSVRFVDEAGAKEALPAIYEQATAGIPGANSRSSAWWHSRIIADEPERRKGRLPRRFVVLQRGSEDVAYAIYRTAPDGDTLVLNLVEVMGLDAQAERSMWQFIFDIDLVSRINASHRPRLDPLSGWIANPRELTPKRTWDSIWIRVIDIVPALESRTYRTPGSIVFAVHDAHCAWNTGTWQLSINQAGVGALAPSDLPPEVNLTPEALGSLYLGGANGAHLLSSGNVTGSPDAVEKLDLLFGWHVEPWCPEVF